MNFYPFHIGDYISHTSHLSDAEDLAYRRMMDLYYLNEMPLQNDLNQLARKVKSTPEIVDLLLNEFFEFEEDGLWHSSRADKEIAKYKFLSESGKKGAEKRWANKDAMPTQSHSNSPPIATPIATKTKNQDQEPLTNIKNKSITPPIGVDRNVWNDFVAHRKSKKAPISATALKGIEVEARKANLSLQAALELCCARGWTGFKAEWVQDKVISMQSRQDKNMDSFHKLTGGMLKPKSNDAVFQPIGAIEMEREDAKLLGI